MAKIIKKYNTVGWFAFSINHEHLSPQKIPGCEIRKKITSMLEELSDEQLASHMAENWANDTIDTIEQFDYEYSVFTDKFYDFLDHK